MDLGSNVYLIVDGGTLTLVDAGYRDKAREILKRVYGQEFEVACLGHGSPIMQRAGGRVTEFARKLDHGKPLC